jgi:hypothetical protein
MWRKCLQINKKQYRTEEKKPNNVIRKFNYGVDLFHKVLDNPIFPNQFKCTC